MTRRRRSLAAIPALAALLLTATTARALPPDNFASMALNPASPTQPQRPPPTTPATSTPTQTPPPTPTPTPTPPPPPIPSPPPPHITLPSATTPPSHEVGGPSLTDTILPWLLIAGLLIGL